MGNKSPYLIISSPIPLLSYEDLYDKLCRPSNPLDPRGSIPNFLSTKLLLPLP